MNTTDYILEQLQNLISIDSPSGFTHKAAQYVMEELTRLGYQPQQTAKGGVLCALGCKEGEGLLMSAHIDTLGAMVAEVKENGRLRLSPVGGMQANNGEAETCRIYTRGGKVYDGTLQLINPSVHVNEDYKTIQRTFDTTEVVIDEKTKSKAETKALGIGNGDFVCFDPRFIRTASGYIKSRFLDDKLSVAILLGYAKSLREENLTPARPTYLHITVFEEVGHGGAASIPAGVTEMLCVDMGCVGDGLECDETMVSICVKDKNGPSNYEMTSRLIALAKEKGIPYAADVYPFYGSDADSALAAGHDLRHALIGAGVYVSHGYERTHLEGVQATYDLIRAYTL